MQVYMVDEHSKDLTFLASKKKKNFSQALRDVIDSGLKIQMEPYKKKANRSEILNKFVGLDKSKGNRNLARNIDRILYVEPYE